MFCNVFASGLHKLDHEKLLASGRAGSDARANDCCGEVFAQPQNLFKTQGATMDLNELNFLMDQLANSVDGIMVEKAPDDNAWGVAFTEGQFLLIEYTEELKKLVISSDLGKPRIEDRKGFYEMLLLVNSQWRETGGIRFALDGPDGSVQLLADQQAEGIHANHLCALLITLDSYAQTWRKFIEEYQGGSTPVTVSLPGRDMLRA